MAYLIGMGLGAALGTLVIGGLLGWGLHRAFGWRSPVADGVAVIVVAAAAILVNGTSSGFSWELSLLLYGAAALFAYLVLARFRPRAASGPSSQSLSPEASLVQLPTTSRRPSVFSGWRALITIVVLVVAFAVGKFAVQDYVWPTVQRMTATSAAVEQAIAEYNPSFAPLLKQEFPEDYEEVIAKSLTAIRSGTSVEEAALRAAEVFEQLRRKYAKFVAFARADELRRAVSTMADLHEDILASEGTSTCGRVALEGPAAMLNTPAMARAKASVERAAVAFFTAVATGVKAPTARSAASDDDWARIVTWMETSGTPASYFDAVALPDPTNPELCPALVALMRAMAEENTVSGERVMASFLAEAAEQ